MRNDLLTTHIGVFRQKAIQLRHVKLELVRTPLNVAGFPYTSIIDKSAEMLHLMTKANESKASRIVFEDISQRQKKRNQEFSQSKLNFYTSEKTLFNYIKTSSYISTFFSSCKLLFFCYSLVTCFKQVFFSFNPPNLSLLHSLVSLKTVSFALEEYHESLYFIPNLYQLCQSLLSG